ncbi:unnamed protein product [Mycena citricolor]|uniref:DUF1688-domain-containing protein n=2 Tax=Mycena citricolor TaxID=2018698 RepID=A0AAD2HU17_9AGAR|nr:unnamed protein product [Mycena citricolor]
MKFSRSEGLAVAAYHMFEAGLFSGDASQPYRVDAVGLARLTPGDVARGMQVDDENTLAGLEGRTQLLINLGTALRASPEFFGTDARPGNLVDFLEKESIPSSPSRKVPVAALWHALIIGLQPIWPPARTNLGGESLGDVWPCAALASDADTNVSSTFVPFHKLTGWLTYSLMEPLTSFLGWQFEGVEDMTGLPEYRNGGLLLDLGVLSLKSNPPIPLPRDEKSGRPKLDAGHPAIVEWRAMTVILLDRIHAALRLSLPAPDLTLAQALESATWKGGREIAKTLRGPEGGPPIDLISDGTVF